MMTYEEARLYIEKVSQTGSILGLESIINLMHELNDVQESLRIIHIAGTNGKGSTGAFIESALIEAGYRVGRYTSPAVFEAFEVWRINRENITQEDYLICLEEVKVACEHMLEKGMPQPTVFEVETALAFVYFYKQKCDYVLLEVGMGGETDATNLITKPLCSVLTSISMDHMQFLGHSLLEIAQVKAGIIKTGCPVVTIDTQKQEVMQVIRKTAEEKQAKLFVAEVETITEVYGEKNVNLTESGNIQNSLAGIKYQHKDFGRVCLKLAGSFQIENSILAACVCKNILQLPNEVILKGLENTTWPGRFEIVSEKPLIILDGAHNENAAEKLAKTIQKHFTNSRITYIIGVLADKEHEKILEHMLPLVHRVYTVTPPNQRALDGAVLAEEVRRLGKEAVYCERMETAVISAVKEVETKEADVIIAFGSLSYLAVLKDVIKRTCTIDK